MQAHSAKSVQRSHFGEVNRRVRMMRRYSTAKREAALAKLDEFFEEQRARVYNRLCSYTRRSTEMAHGRQREVLLEQQYNILGCRDHATGPKRPTLAQLDCDASNWGL